jgi:hypothetical protein
MARVDNLERLVAIGDAKRLNAPCKSGKKAPNFPVLRGILVANITSGARRHGCDGNAGRHIAPAMYRKSVVCL